MAKSTRSIYSSTSIGTYPSGEGGGKVSTGEGVVNPAPNTPSVIPFTLKPGQANTAVPINYISTTGIKLFNSAILKFPDLFDGE